MAGGGTRTAKLPALTSGRRRQQARSWGNGGSQTARDHHGVPLDQSKKAAMGSRGGQATARAGLSERSQRQERVEQSLSSLMLANIPKYYTVRATLEAATVLIQGTRKERSVKVSMSLDGVTYMSASWKLSEGEHLLSLNDTYIFHPQGSLLGSFLLIRVLMNPVKSEPEEVAMGVVDVSGASSSDGMVRIQRKLKSYDKTLHVSVTLGIQVLSRNKSFSISWGSGSASVFRRAGFAIASHGLVSTPQPYHLRGLPRQVSFGDLRLVRKVAEETEGYEVWRAMDSKQRSYTVSRFLVTKRECREMLTSSLAGLIDMEEHRPVGLSDAFLVDLNVSLVLEDWDGVYLREAIRRNGAPAEHVASLILKQILSALQFLHEHHSRIHNDVDARNVLCLRNGEVRLRGFCYSHKLIGTSQSFCGPYLHMSPERLLGLECSFPSDVWSLGVMAYELATGSLPRSFVEMSSVQNILSFKNVVINQPSPSLKDHPNISSQFRHFVDCCLKKNARSRSSITELLAHSFCGRQDAWITTVGTWVQTGQASHARLRDKRGSVVTPG